MTDMTEGFEHCLYIFGLLLFQEFYGNWARSVLRVVMLAHLKWAIHGQWPGVRDPQKGQFTPDHCG